MIKHYLITGWRNLLKYKTYSLINIIGLAIGIASSILILAFVKHELSVNQNFSAVKQIFRVNAVWKNEEIPATAATIAPIFVNYPEVARTNRFWGGSVIVNVGENSFRDEMWITDSTFFQIFDFPFRQGDPQNALNHPDVVVLTEQLAQKYFGKTEVLGETIKFQIWNGQGYRDYKVTGVLENLPYNSITSFANDVGFETKAQLFVSMLNFSDFLDKQGLESWEGRGFISHIQLRDASQAATLQQKLPAMLDKHCPPDIRPKLNLKLDALSDLYLKDFDKARLKSIRGLLILVFIIILLASINFMNLATARSSTRAKEVGVRKVLGSVRKQLLWQFMSEAILLSFVALLVGIVLAELCLGEFNAFFDRELTLDYGNNIFTTLALIGLMLFVGIVSGSYPALFLSSFHPVLALKGGLKSGKANLYTRRVLVILQFVVAVGFATMAHIIAKQLDFVINQDLGFNQENVLVIKSVPREWNLAGVKKLEVIKQQLTANPEILSASISWAVPSEGEGGPSFARLDWDENQAVNMIAYRVDEVFLGTFDLQLVEGRFFSKDFFHSDTTNSIVLNQAAVKAFSWESAVGKSLKSEGRIFNVIGVVKDFNQGPLYHKIKPLVLRYVYGFPIYRLLSVKFRSQNVTQSVANIEKIWKNVYPNAPFEYTFMTDLVKENDYLRCLPGPVGIDFIHRRAPHQRDRHSQSIGRHGHQYCRLASEGVFQARACGQSYRMAFGLFLHEQVAARLGLSHRD
jgi:putative ABC transport system permease protein